MQIFIFQDNFLFFSMEYAHLFDCHGQLSTSLAKAVLTVTFAPNLIFPIPTILQHSL